MLIMGHIATRFRYNRRREFFDRCARSYMAQRIPMTPDGQKMLLEKLKRLKRVERPQIIASIEDALSHGDIAENAEYDTAKERQNHVNQQIREIEHKLSLAEIIDPKSIDSTKVVFGATVTLESNENSEQMTYRIVGSDEADAGSGKISIDSPIARAMIGKEEGDEVRVRTPKGLKEFEIVGVKYG